MGELDTIMVSRRVMGDVSYCIWHGVQDGELSTISKDSAPGRCRIGFM